MNKPILFLIPFAGGSSYSLTGLTKELADTHVQILELPGRGKRIAENLLTDADLIVDDLLKKVKLVIEPGDVYYIYGHSMGTLIGYLLIHKLIESGFHAPACFFVSGRGGPARVQSHEKTFLLSSNDFWRKIKELGGSPDEVLNDESLMEFFEPILKADFEAIEKFQYVPRPPLNSRIIGFYGSEEETKEEEMELWQKESIYPIELFQFYGNHFFIFAHWKEISDKIKSIMITYTEF